ncbi:hypothetical protein CWI75_09865 [Kineobactrum sediminis]|uniref:VanZ-like domain-containing protein n=1 Tax=Kineobactrum sediminis TaxID=1905677 RepID=A0A2N5Y126_9GAMM|nr:VanZ family protein [Kineobactrum sediminis]PLW82096.1 hypothetical protein CWI75_09865 [Kineobactrum sediminis]
MVDKRVTVLHAGHSQAFALFALVGTLVLLLLPGPAVEVLVDLARGWFPASAPDVPGLELPMDKLGHASLFALCGVLLVWGWLQGATVSRFVLAFMGLTVMAVCTELAQLAIPGRSGDVWDVVADMVGAVLGIWLGVRSGAWLVARRVEVRQ